MTLISNTIFSGMMIALLFLSSCHSEQTPQKESENKLDFSDITKKLAGNREYKEENYKFMNSNVIVILAEELNKDSSKIKIQDYIDDQGSFIPVFTSEKEFAESSKGSSLGKGVIEISALFMLSIMNDRDRIRLNPGLKSEAYFDVKDLKKRYSAELEKLKSKMSINAHK